LSQNKTNGKHFFQFEVRIVARQIGFDESQQKLTMNISFNLKIMEARKIGFDDTFLTEGRTGLNNYGFK
jgi:hypothetical protein